LVTITSPVIRPLYYK